MRNRYILIITALMMSVAYNVNAAYMTTATSVSWGGAYASVADGLEATLYNPAGVAMSSHKIGLNILGSYALRFYNNALSTNDAIRFLEKSSSGENMTDFFHGILGNLSSAAFNTGLELSLLNFISFFKFKHFSLGISVLPKTNMSMAISNSVFSTLLDKIDLSDSLKMSASMTMLQYFDFNGSISTRVKFLEKYLHVDAIYAGASTHIYIPTAFVNAVFDEISISPNASLTSSSGITAYRLKMSGKTRVGVMKAIADSVSQSLPKKSSESSGDALNIDMQSLMENSGTVGWGLGFDMGAIVQIKRWVRVGFSVTDLGFVSFPSVAAVDNDVVVDLTADLMSDDKFSSYASLPGRLMDGFGSSFDGSAQSKETTCFMPDTSIRLGVAFTPLINKFIEITAVADISVTDLNKCINGNVPTFNFATGVEFLPRVNWFEFVFRMAFCYNTSSNMPSFSFGTGLHLGALQMEIGVKGLEALVENWGAREFALGLDCKFVF